MADPWRDRAQRLIALLAEFDEADIRCHMWCFLCGGGWSDKDTPIEHEPYCWWVRSRALLAEMANGD